MGAGWLNDASILLSTSNPTILNCTFTNNIALIGGGMCNLGIFNASTNPTLISCTFTADSAVLGGGIANIGIDGESSPTIINSYIQGNSAFAAGGILNLGGSLIPSLITSQVFSLNNQSDPSRVIEGLEKAGFFQFFNNKIENLPASSDSGPQAIGLSDGESNPKITNSLITGNLAISGGGMVNFVLVLTGGEGASSPVVTNSSFVANTAGIGGAVINGEFLVAGGNARLQGVFANCIFWNNLALTGPEFYHVFDGNDDQIVLHHSITAGDYNALNTNCSFCIDDSQGGNKYLTDPLFKNAPSPLTVPTAAGDFHVKINSPAIDMGDDAAIILALTGYDFVDLDDSARILNTVDIGTYEYQYPDCNNYTGLSTIYVDVNATGANNGLNWDDAFVDLQLALMVTRLCDPDSILVAQGTYYPSAPDTLYDQCSSGIDTIYPPDRTQSFDIPDSTVVMGGYDAATGLRDYECNQTILCGDIDEDGTFFNNSYHVVITTNVSDVTTVDGFYISKGAAIDPFVLIPSLNNFGGGWLNYSTIPPIDDMLVASSNPRILNSYFLSNRATVGGGLANVGIFGGSTNPTIYNCSFNQDSALLGGGMANIGIDGESSPEITNSRIQGNAATSAGGILNLGGSISSLGIVSGIANNTTSADPTKMLATLEKAGIIQTLVKLGENRTTSNAENGPQFTGFSDGGSSPVLTNCLVTGNVAINGGGIINFVLNLNGNTGSGESNTGIINTLVGGNSALFGGGMLNGENNGGEVSPYVINSIFWNNIALNGPDMYHFFDGIGDMIVFHNNLSESDIAALGSSCGGTCIDDGFNANKFPPIDPQFYAAPPGSDAPTTAGDFRVRYTSPAIDMGINGPNTTLVDLDSNSRISNFIIDIGPYEYVTPDCSIYSGIIYVDTSATGANNGTTWDSAFTELEDALEVAYFCDIDSIFVAQGVYYPGNPDTLYISCSIGEIDTIYLPLRTETFNIPDSTVVLGGFPNGGGGLDSRDWVCNKTILCGDIDRDGTLTGNSFHVVTTENVDSLTLVDGFCIIDGNADSTEFPFNAGGGWYNNGSGIGNFANPTIRNCVFTGNRALSGAGMYNNGSSDGDANPTLINCIFNNNQAFIINAGFGGAVYNDGTSRGQADPLFINGLFTGNYAFTSGGAAYNEGSSDPYFINCTFSGNLSIDGGAIYSAGNGLSSDPVLINCIVWNNSSDFFNGGGASTTASYSMIQGSGNYTDGGSNKPDGTDPLFVNAPPFTAAPTAAGDFHVMEGSLAINMGDNLANTYPTDLDRLNRIVEGIIDIGPYEKLINCTNDTLYVLEDGTIPSLPIDSFLRDTLPEGFVLLVNGEPFSNMSMIDFDCEDLLDNTFDILLVRNCDTIDGCDKFILILDTFEKNLVCNDLVNISLGNGCQKVVTTEDVLENIKGCRTVLYDVELRYPFGTHKFPPANDQLDESHIGYTMVYSVYETLTGNSCWGYLKVEDKLPPVLNCTNDTIPCYVLPTLPLLAANADDCYDGKVELVSDEWFDYGCDSVLSGYVIRTIQGTDRWGNFRRCESIISIERTELDSLVCPELVELPCEIRTQIGGGKTLKTPITVDQTKVTPAYLLSLQKKTWEFTDNTKDWILSPSVQVVPQIEGQNIWPGAGGICKINSIFKDSRLDICGSGFKIHREWTIVDWCTQEERTCIQYISVRDTVAPVMLQDLTDLYYNASAHDCVASVTIPALVAGKDFRDCNVVEQTYILQYADRGHPGKTVVLTGSLPSKPLLLPTDSINVTITLTDKCNNRSITSRNIFIYDITPPTPVCDEFTQVTVDPVTCWAKVKAKDLDNGSRDNCCDVLHFAAAHMDSIAYWTKYWTDTLEARCGKVAFWADKEFYDFQIERWINAYVFKDEIKFDECGTSQVVLRVYEACGVPVYDPHLWPCTEHQWFWYNTDQRFRIEHNWNFFHKDGPKDCNYRYRIQCIEDHQKRLRGLCEFVVTTPKPGGYCYAQYVGAVEDLYFGCESDFYFPQANNSEAFAPGNRCSNRLYSDCMINVLVDDKQAPVVAELEDVLVYCDRAPDYASGPACDGGDEYLEWPGLLKDSKGKEHGYYGGSDFLGIHRDEHETDDACGYDNAHFWSPIYCRSWLYVDSFDAAGQIDPKQYFETLVLFDKTRPARTLLAKEFSITDNCRLNDTTLKVTDEGSLNGCREGWIQRTWTIRDKCDNPITVKQKVVVKHRSDFEVIFPEDKVVECDFLNTTDPEDAGTPIISDDECEQVGVQYKDKVFTVEDSACYKIVRTWTLIDWCIYNPNAQHHYSDVIVDDRLRADTGNRSCVYRHLKDNNDGYMKYIQVIKVIDKVAPVVTTRDTTICIYGEDCKSALVRIPFSGTDNCTAASELSYRVEVDLNATDGVFTNRTYAKTSIDLSTQSNPTEFVYSPAVAGKHVVHVIVKDNCGNEDTSSYRFELKDCKKPTPYCYNGIATVIMPSTGKITVWAKDLDAGSFDNCTLAANLKFSFSANANESSKEYSCTDIPDGKSRTIPVEIWVTDEAGNQDHCTTYILLQDNSGNACPDVAGLSVTIAGTIQTETKEPVEHVRVNIYGGPVQMNYQTGVKGTYHFEGLPSKSNYSIKSSRDDQPMNGISTLDLVLIQKHILGIELLDSPYKILAADIDNDKQITAIDLVELRKLILATYEDLPNNESWRFIPKSTTFNDPQNPWNAGAVSEVMEMKEVTTDYKSGDFIGIKVGDVNASVTPHSLMGVEVRGNENGLLFEINDQVFKRGDVVRIDFRSPNFRGISGWQGTLNISDQLSGISSQLISGSLNMADQNMGKRYAEEGKITMSWNTNAKSGLDIDDQQVLFTLVFKAQENGRLSEVLRIGSQHTIAESYQGRGPSGRDPERSLWTRGELGNLGLRFVHNGNEIVAKSALYQNYPNPFDQRTVIGINLANQGKGTLKVYDATGRTIKSVERDWTKGYHEVWFDRKEIGATGVLYYRFESGFFNASKKMILID